MWLHDTNITEFATSQLKILKQSNCSSCSFFWIGLVQSLAKDDIYFINMVGVSVNGHDIIWDMLIMLNSREKVNS